MFKISGTEIRMTEGDYGVDLPVAVKGTTVTANDVLDLTIKDAVNGTTVLELTVGSPTNGVFDLYFAQEESALLTPGEYGYSLDWIQPGTFVYCLVPVGPFIVEEKA